MRGRAENESILRPKPSYRFLQFILVHIFNVADDSYLHIATPFTKSIHVCISFNSWRNQDFFSIFAAEFVGDAVQLVQLIHSNISVFARYKYGDHTFHHYDVDFVFGFFFYVTIMNFAIHITIISDVAANIDIVYLNFFIPVSFAYYARSEDIQVFASGYIYDAVRILFYDLFENADNSCNVVLVNCFALKIDFETMF